MTDQRMTLRQYNELAARAAAERARSEEPAATRHERQVTNVSANGIRNLSAEEYCTVARMVGETSKSVGYHCVYPLDAPVMFNGGEPCDMWTGPCSCGATHKDGI